MHPRTLYIVKYTEDERYLMSRRRGDC